MENENENQKSNNNEEKAKMIDSMFDTVTKGAVDELCDVLKKKLDIDLSDDIKKEFHQKIKATIVTSLVIPMLVR